MVIMNLKQDHKRIYDAVHSDTSPDIYFFTMVILSCTVATYGLLSNSTAVVIGAMLIAPLMGPILGGALAIASGSNELLKTAGKAEAAGAVLAVLLSSFLTMILPNAELTPEVLARTTPTILDLIIALASGAAGTYAICAKPQGATLPGVAIATALMPPLCVVGIGLAKQNFAVLSGALLLFLANMIAINVAAIAMFELAGFSQQTCFEEADSCTPSNTAKRRIWYPLILLVLISIPLAYIMYQTYSTANTERVVKTTIGETLNGIAPHSSIISASYKKEDNAIAVEAAFQTTKVITPENIRQMENLLELKLGKPVRMTVDVVLVQKVDDKRRVDTFQELLPKVKEKEIVEIVKSSTPEEIIEKTIIEKVSLLKDVRFDDFTLEYRRGSATYTILIKLSSPTPVDDKLAQSIKNVLEDQLKRRVEVRIEVAGKQPQPALTQ